MERLSDWSKLKVSSFLFDSSSRNPAFIFPEESIGISGFLKL